MQADLIDSTKAVVSIHQDHDYAHHPGGIQGIGISVEAERNRELVGGKSHFFVIRDRTHVLTANDFRRSRDGWWAWRSLRTSKVLHPSLPLPVRLGANGLNGAIDLTRDAVIKVRNVIKRR